MDGFVLHDLHDVLYSMIETLKKGSRMNDERTNIHISPVSVTRAPVWPFGKLVALGRALSMAGCTLWYLLPLLAKSAWYGYDMRCALSVRKRWARRVLHLLGVRIRLECAPPQVEGAALYVGNHQSYLDPVVVLREVEALPVAKAEVASWPLIGFAARATGIMYVKRESSKSRLSTLVAIRQTLERGHSVLLYPEGTTQHGPSTLPFRLGAFRVAAELGIPVVPVAIHYPDPADAWVGDDAFVPHFVRTFAKKHLEVYIAYGPVCIHHDAEHLRRHTRHWIDRRLAAWCGALPPADA